MAKAGKAASYFLPGTLACHKRHGIYLALYLLAAMCHGTEFRSLAARSHASAGTEGSGVSTDARMLVPGVPVSDTVSAGEAHVYALDLSAGQRALIEMMKGDLRVKVSVCAPPGRDCAGLASRRYGRLELAFTADAPGRYEIEVRSSERERAARSYELRLVELTVATEQQRLADRAARVAAEAEGLRELQEQRAQHAALSKYDEAQQLWEAAGELGRAAEALCEMGDLYLALSQYRQALDRYTKALSLGERSGDPLARLAALGGVSYVSLSLNEKQKALASAQEVLNAIGDANSADYRRVKAQALNTIGEVHYSFGELRKSVEMFDLALPLWTDVGDRGGQALALLNLGYSYSDLGNPQVSSEYFQRSLALWQILDEKRGTAQAQTALGGTYSTLGEEQAALNLHRQAVEHFRAIGDQQGAATALNGVASAYYDLHEYQSSFDNYFEALWLYESIGNRDFIALGKFLVGRALYRRGETERAFNYYRESLDLSREVRDRVLEAHALQGLAAAYFARGDAVRALAQLDAALQTYREGGNRRSQAYALNDIGHLHASSGDLSKALTSYAEALPIMREIRDRRGEALTLFNTAKAELGAGNLTAALSLIEDSLTISESLRTKVRNSRLRTSYFVSVHEHYELCVKVLMRLHAQQPSKGFDALALVASERARARSLLDSLFEEKVQPQKGLATELLHRERELLRELDDKAEYLSQQLSRRPAGEETERVAQEIRGLTMEYDEVRSKLREQSPRLATLTQPAQISAEEIRRVVSDDDTLLLEFSLGDERSYLWAVSADEIKGYDLPDRATIEGLARRTYNLLTARQTLTGPPSPADEARLRESDAEYWRQAAALSAMLLGPVSDRLGTKRLLIVGDGFLRHIPFEALPAPNVSAGPAGAPELLFFDHEIVGLPSALSLAALRSEKRSTGDTDKTIAVFADPVFEADDPRVLAAMHERREPAGEATEGEDNLAVALRDFSEYGGRPVLSRLPSTLREARAIAEAASPDEVTLAAGFDATKERVAGRELKDYRVVHFATHGLLNSASPELSGIVLSLVDERGASRKGFLRLHDIYSMELSADLVVISGCRTGLGRNVKGEGIVGLTSGFMYSGAKSVVSSLWKVDDDATAELMTHFYAAMLKDDLPPAAALRKAKRNIWQQEHWRAPFYWAAFTLQGEYADRVGVPRRWGLTRILLIGTALLFAIVVCAYVVRRRRGGGGDDQSGPDAAGRAELLSAPLSSDEES